MTSVVIINSALLISGCETTPPPAPSYLSTAPKYAVLLTENVRIESVDGSWDMKYRTPTTPPKVYETSRRTGFTDVNNAVFSVNYLKGDYDVLYPSMHEKAIDVLIHVDGRKTPLYGKIIFMTVRNSTTDASAKRMWSVAIPNEYIRTANSGDMSVVYQPYKVFGGDDLPSWVLHMSALPF